MDLVITKEEWLEFKRHVGYKILKQMIENSIKNHQTALGSGVTLGENIIQDTASIVGRISGYTDVLEFDPVEEIIEDESRSTRFQSYS